MSGTVKQTNIKADAVYASRLEEIKLLFIKNPQSCRLDNIKKDYGKIK